MSDTVLDNDYATFIAGETITQFALVKLESDGYLDECDGTADNDTNVIGVAMNGASEGGAVQVRLLNRGGIVPVIADLNDLAVGDNLYTAAGGEVTDSNLSGTMVGIAMEASDTAGDIIQMVVAMGQVYNLT
jgi:predicted enzyme related to lactoylglutathione lyase